MSPKQRSTDHGEDVTVVVRSQDVNGRALLCQAIAEIDRTPLYHMDTCDEMTHAFYSTITGLLDLYMPLTTVKRHHRQAVGDRPVPSSHPLPLTRA